MTTERTVGEHTAQIAELYRAVDELRKGRIEDREASDSKIDPILDWIATIRVLGGVFSIFGRFGAPILRVLAPALLMGGSTLIGLWWLFQKLLADGRIVVVP